jgi:hypothetical protein
LQLAIRNGISFVGVKMFNFIYNRPRSIKHIENEFFGGLDFMMIGDFYEASLMKDSWIFQNVKDNVNALAPNFWQTYVQCYELNKVM